MAALTSISEYGCGNNIYLHDKQLAQNATDAKSNFAKVDYSAIFDREHAITNDLLQRRGAAVAGNQVALRNYNASILINGDTASIKKSAMDDLQRVTG